MVSTVSDHVLKLMKPVPVVNNLEEFQLSDDVAGGSKLPYSGYVEVEIQIPFIQNGPMCIPILVVPKSDLSDRVPDIVGTNILRICQEKLDCLDEEFKFQNSGILHFYPYIRILAWCVHQISVR
jgi:hypothetical protein